MPENKARRITDPDGWILQDPATGSPPPAAPGPVAHGPRPDLNGPGAVANGPNLWLGVGVAVGGWTLAAAPIMVMGAYIRFVEDCAASGSLWCPGASEGGTVPMVVLVIACMVLGPLFLGVAAATKMRWARLVTALLALPVIFSGYDLLTHMYL